MRPRLVWTALLALALATGLMAWLTPSAQGTGLRTPKTIRYVSPTGLNSGDCSGSPCLTIGYAITQSVSGDRIEVASGWYTEHITMANGVSIYGQGWGTAEGTVITGNFSSNRATVYIPASVGASTVLSGVQVAGGGTGDPTTSLHGGIYSPGGSPTIINTWMNNNTSNYGGGVYVVGGAPTFINVAAWNNRANYGGGFYLCCNAVVTMTSDSFGTHGTVYLNSATSHGGGFNIGQVTVTLSGFRVWSNSAHRGGGAYINDSANQITLQSNDVYSNAATVSGGGIFASQSSALRILDNAIRRNSAHLGGGGVYVERSSGLLKGNVIRNNIVTDTTSFGGGASIIGSSSGMTIEGNWFEGNTADPLGGGLMIGEAVVALINANGFVTNTAQSGGGMYITSAAAVTATNNIVARNIVSGTNPGGFYIVGSPAARVINNTIADNDGDGVYFSSSPDIVIVNNIISGNGSHGIERSGSDSYSSDYNDVFSNGINYSNVATGTHDLSINPLFIASGDLFNYYHLRATSPVSKTGSLVSAPPRDIDNEPRVICTSMGADQICRTILYLPLIFK